MGDVYFALSSNFSVKLENSDQINVCNQESLKMKENINSPNVNFDEIDCKKESSKFISYDSELKHYKNDLDSFLNNFSCLEESFSFKFHSSNKKSLNYSLSKNNSGDYLKRKSSEIKNDIFSKSKKTVQTHSTPKQGFKSVENISHIPHLSDICDKGLLSDKITFELHENETNYLKSLDSSIQSDKELSTNETSGDIFHSDETAVENLEEGSKNHSKEKMKSETSNDLFDGDSMNEGLKNIDLVSNSESKQILPNCEKICQLSQNQSPSDLVIKPSELSYNLKLNFNDSSHQCYKSISGPIAKDSAHLISTNTQIKSFLKPKDYSKLWTSWGSSLNDSDFSDNGANPNSYLKVPKDLAVDNKELSQQSSLTFNSNDNSLFKCFNSNDTLIGNKTIDKVLCDQAVCSKQENCDMQKNKIFEKVTDLSFSKYNFNSSSLRTSSKFPEVKIIDILDSDLDCFLKKLSKSMSFSLSVSCEKLLEKKKTIGPPKNSGRKDDSDNKYIVDPGIVLKGISICCGGPSFYIEFSNKAECSDGLKNGDRMKMIREFFHSHLQNGTVIVHCLIEQYKMLWQGCNISLQNHYNNSYFDPSIAAWLLDPSSELQSLDSLIEKYWPQCNRKNNGMNDFSLGLHYWSSLSGRERASSEACIVYHLMPKLINDLKTQKLHKSFSDIEMPSTIAFAKMEQNGLGFNNQLAITYLQDLQRKQKDILEKSYHMAGRKFNISSSKEISRILYKELKLSTNISPNSPKIHQHLAIDAGSRSRKLPPELKTNKECLEKIIHLHPLPKAILDYRRLSFATSKVLMPLLRKNKFNSFFQMNRMHSNCYVYTLTGRIHMYSPNLQFVPRNFNVENIINEQIPDDMKTEDEDQCCDEDIAQYGVSLRNLFIPSNGSILLAADYSQLELRILAHLSKEKNLLSSLNSGEDVFKKIASVWKNIPVSSISIEIREHAKRISYGIIYGMSAKTLSQQLKCSEDEAIEFMKTFKSSYPSLDAYFQSVIKDCFKNGYITTITHRRRYLPLIKSTNKSERGQAERQAINTTIQGSAADLIKTAMVKIENELFKKFPEVITPYSSIYDSVSPKCEFRGGFLVLQMHDELIYEVNEKDLKTVVLIVKKGMEETTKLTVKLPVKIRIGSTWGLMKEYS